MSTRFLRNFAKTMDILAENSSAAFIPVIFLLVFFQVLTRVIGYPLVWSEELTRYLMIATTHIAAAPALTRNIHPRITFLVEKTSYFPHSIINLVISIIEMMFCILLMIEGIKQAVQGLSMQTTTLGIPSFWPYMTIPIGSFLLLVCILDLLFNSNK